MGGNMQRGADVNYLDSRYDVLGIGFGPSNLALAIALDELATQGQRSLRSRFIEKQSGFLWHGGMLLPQSDMQISFLKDLVTLRNPASRFSFVHYLHEQRRLEAFINLKTFYPSRIEFNDYLAWAAAAFADRCAYGEEVLAVEPLAGRDGIDQLLVCSRDASGRESHYHTRDLIVAVGGRPRIPEPFRALAGQARLFHSADYLRLIDGFTAADRPEMRIAVIGGGQSAGEIAFDLHNRFRQAGIDLIFRHHALKPADDTPFVNEIFNADFIDFLFRQPTARRDALIQEFHNTNYAVLDPDLLRLLYGILYQERVEGRPRLRLANHSAVVGVEAGSSAVGLRVLDQLTDQEQLETYDLVVLATGYERTARPDFLAPLDPYRLGEAVGRDYRLPLAATVRPRVYLQGCSEPSHGLSDTLLSVLAIRSQEIATALLAGEPVDRPARRTVAAQ